MEFNSNVSKLQGIILSLRRRGFLLESDPVKEEIEELIKLFEGITDEHLSLQMIFFMILNADLSVSHILCNNENLRPFICIFPPLKEKLVVQLIWKLKLHKQFMEIIKNCSSSISGNLLNLFVKEVTKNFEDIEALCQLMCSIFIKIHNVHLNLHRDKGINKIFFCFEGIYVCIRELFKTYKHIFTAKESINLVAKNLLKLFESILFMVRLYNDSQYKFIENDLFEGTIDLETQLDDVLMEPSKKCLNVLFESFNEVLEIITVDLWLHLSIMEIKPNCSLSYQEMIGEICFYICEEVKDVEPKFLNFIEMFKIKPKLKIEKLLANAEIENDLNLWNEALESYFSTRVENTSFIDTFCLLKEEKVINYILEFLDKFDVKLINEISRECIEMLKIDEDFILLESKIIKLFLMALKKSKNIDHRSLFREIFVTHTQVGNKIKNFVGKKEEIENFNERLIKTFNQSSMEKLPETSELASLCLESTEKTLNQICRAATFGNKQSEFYSEIIYTFQDAFVPFLDDVLENKIKCHSFSDKEKEYFLLFLTKLKNFKLLRPPFYYKVFRILNDDLKTGKHDRIIFLLKLVQMGLGSELFFENKFVFLVYTSQVLELLSWDLETFSTTKCQGTCLTKEIVLGLLQNVQEEDRGSPSANWALKNIERCTEMTQTYFCNLWLRLGRPWPYESTELPTVLFKLILSEEKDKILPLNKMLPKLEIVESITLSLAMLIPRLIGNMWLVLFDVLKRTMNEIENDCIEAEYQTIVLFSSAIHLLTLLLNDNLKTFACYEYCLRNYCRIIKSISHEIKKSFSNKILERMVFFLQKIKNEDQKESSSMTVLPALIFLCRGIKIDFSPDANLTASNVIRLLKVKKVEEAIRNSLKDFRNGDQKN